MFLRHFGLMVLFVAVGCGSSHLAPMPDAGRPFVPEDAGLPLGRDSGLYEWPDVSPPLADVGTVSDVGTDAGEEATLTVSLHIDTPPGRVIPQVCTGVMFARFDFLSGSAPVAITAITVHRVGVGDPRDFSNIFLVDSVSGRRLSTGRTVLPASDTATFHFLDGPILLPPHVYWTAALYGDVNASVSGGQHGFEIVSVDAVETDGAMVVGGFPVRGNIFTVSSYVTSRLDIRRGSLLPGVYVGDMGAEIANFTLSANGGDIDVVRISLIQGGSVSPDDLIPRAAIVDAEHRVLAWINASWSRNARIGDQLVIQPDLGGLTIPEGGTVSLSVFADINGPSGRTVRLYAEYPSDVEAVETFETPGWMPVAVCNSHQVFGGCNAPDQGHYDGSFYFGDDRSDPPFSEVTIY